MCGIAGYILKDPVRGDAGRIRSMLRSIRSRGPDDEGVCLISGGEARHFATGRTVKGLSKELPRVDAIGELPEHDIAFAHTRYSIIDLSSAGHQPFVSSDRTVTAVFNGEIYNYVEIRKELESLGVRFQTCSDTEVLVEGYRYWKESVWSRLNGFWAVVIYDSSSGRVILSRDRIGVAPLYYRQTSRGLYFASYIEPLIDVDGKKASVDEDIVSGFLYTGIKDHDNSTFYKDIKTVPSASFTVLERGETLFDKGKTFSFWKMPEKRLAADEISFSEAVSVFRDIFFDAVKIRMRADVKIGFELSGGLDSSSVVAAAAELTGGGITTYTAKIKDADEEPYARSMLDRYDLDYHVIQHIEKDFVRDKEGFADLMEEPYDNPNDYTHNRMLRHMKSEGTHVVITGAGGDEVLSGYESSFWPAAYRLMRKRGGLSYLRGDWYEFCRRFRTVKEAKRTLLHYIRDPFVRGEDRSSVGDIPDSSASKYRAAYRSMPYHQRTLYHFNVALVPYYMRSSDHFTMGIPIEHRFPLLDYRIVDIGLKMPVEYLFRNGWTKYLLRKAMEPYLPNKVVWRRNKMGFTFPFREYLSRHENVFRPFLEDTSGPFGKYFRDVSYDGLLRDDPSCLWRYLSVAIWSARGEIEQGGRI